MYFGFWNNVSFPSPWQYYLPTSEMFQQSCTLIPQTQTHLQENNLGEQKIQINPSPQKKGLISLTRDDLIEAGYENTKKLWSQQQDQLLLKMIDQQKVQWKQIEKYIPERTQKMCYSRYRRLLSQTKHAWTKQQDQTIRELITIYGQNWKQYTIHFRNRSSKQIKQRYINYLRPEIKRDQWTIDEDLKIIECINSYGKKWKQIEKELGNRTDNQVKNRYYGRLKILYRNKIVRERKKTLEKGRKREDIVMMGEVNVRVEEEMDS